MPPELLAFLQTTGQLPRSAVDLASFQAAAPPRVGVPNVLGPPGAPPLVFNNPFIGGGFPGVFGPQGPGPDQELEAQARALSLPPNFASRPDFGPDAFSGPLPGVPDFSIPPPPFPTDPTLAGPAGPRGPAGPPGAEAIARARLGGGPGGFAFPAAAPTPQPGPTIGGIGGTDFGGLPGVPRTGAGDVLSLIGAQQQADVAQQRQLAADVMSSLIGGIGGGALGAIGGGGGGGGGGAGASAAANTVSPSAIVPLATPPRREIIRPR